MIVLTLSEKEREMVIEAMKATKFEFLVAFDPIDQAFKIKVDGTIWGPPMGILQK